MFKSSLTRVFYALVAVAGAIAIAGAANAKYEDIWPELRENVFGDAKIQESDGLISIEAPVRAEDSALVPVTIRMPAETAKKIKKVTLIADKNPAPVAATFEFGEAAGDGERKLSTRIRINRYTFLRAVAETTGGKLHMAAKFVKATGGCSAPFGKDYETALIGLGNTKLKSVPASKPGTHEAQVMIRHPSFTGMQIDPMTRITPPARFVEDLVVKSGDKTVFRMVGGITISEDPHFRFTYQPADDGVIEVSGKDTEGSEISAKAVMSGS